MTKYMLLSKEYVIENPSVLEGVVNLHPILAGSSLTVLTILNSWNIGTCALEDVNLVKMINWHKMEDLSYDGLISLLEPSDVVSLAVEYKC